MKQQTLQNETEEKLEVKKEIMCIKNKEKVVFSKKENFKIIFLVFLSVMLFLSIIWLYENTGNVTLEQLVFHLKVPIQGTNVGMVKDYLYWTFPKIAAVVGGTGLIIFIFESKVKISTEKKKKILFIVSSLLLIASFIYALVRMDIKSFIVNQLTASTFIEEEYVEPSQVNITFPEEKQNLIYIYLESIENTFASKEDGGMYEIDRMPELTQMAKENISFSNNEKLGGALYVLGTNWTVASMVSQTSGVPLKISIEQNSYGKYSTFLPGVCSLGEILKENGYKNYLLLGSESQFGGRKLYFEQHGEYEIWDYNSAIEEERMKEEDKVWWGYSDSDLFKYAKEQLTEISKKDEPFNFTMLTVDTHFTDGYICSRCENQFEDQYSNVIRCSSKQIAEFVDWIKEQPFFKNTTVIVTGDHITMQSSIAEEAKENKYGERTVYNAIINSRTQPIKTTNRLFFTTDMYPTTLAALGVKVEGDRLGLGTNLFSDKETLIEKYGLEYTQEEIKKNQHFITKS